MAKRVESYGDLPRPQLPPITLPGQLQEMTKEEKLKARLYSYAPLKAPVNPRALKFKGVTQTQARRLLEPIERRVEPLPSLQKYQETHQPEFIQKREMERLEKLAKLKVEAEKALKKQKRKDMKTLSIDSLDDLIPTKKTSSVESEIEPSAVEKFYRKEFPILTYEEIDQSKTPEPIKGRGKSKIGRVHTTENTPCTEHTIKFIPSYAGMTDMHEIVKAVIDNKRRIACLYLSPAVPKDSVEYHYYNLRVVEYANVYPQDHLSISYLMVTRIRYGQEMEKMTIPQWVREVEIFYKLREYQTFRLHRMWKAFNVWLKNMISLKTNLCKKFLNENLYVLNPTLRPAVFKVNSLCLTTECLEMVIKEPEAMCLNLPDFINIQITQLTFVKQKMDRFRELVADTVYTSCRTCLIEAGFLPDDEATSSIRQSNSAFYLESERPMIYTMQANKRAICKRLTNFITMLDYMVMTTIHRIMVNSVLSFNSLMSSLMNLVPPESDIVKMNPQIDTEDLPTEDITVEPAQEISPLDDVKKDPGKARKSLTVPPPEKPQVAPVDDDIPYRPMIISELMLSPEKLWLSPSEIEVSKSLTDLMKLWQSCARDLENMTPDAKFNNFTSPKINNKQEEKTCGDGPNIRMVLKNDEQFQEGLEAIMVSTLL